MVVAHERPPHPPVPTACLIWKDPFMTANADTLTSAILAAGGARNVFGGLPHRYSEITPAELAGLAAAAKREKRAMPPGSPAWRCAAGRGQPIS